MFGVLALGAIVLTVSWFRQNMTITEMQRGRRPTQQFEEVRRAVSRAAAADSTGRRPAAVRGGPREPERLARRRSRRCTSSPAIDDEGNSVTFSLPFWLLRMKSGPIRLSAYQQGWDDRGVSFRVEDIEKHGPGIIVDVTEPNAGPGVDLGSSEAVRNRRMRARKVCFASGAAIDAARGARVVQAGAARRS